MAASAGAVDIRPQPTSGKPRLEEVPAGGPPPQASPPPPVLGDQGATVEGQSQPAGAPTIVQHWQPEQAALAVTGAHNVAGAVPFARQRELYEAWHAAPTELDAAAPSIARVLDRIPWVRDAAGGAGPLGILSDALIAANAIVDLELRHWSEVVKARERLERNEASAPRRPAAAPAAPPSNGAKPRPAAPPRPTVVADPDDDLDGGFHYDPADLAFLSQLPPTADAAHMQESRPNGY